jgi:hypothetical protein
MEMQVSEAARYRREEDFIQTVIDYARLRGWLVSHFRPGRTRDGWRTPIQGDAGFPDLVMARIEPTTGQARLIICELKSLRGRVTDDQSRWLQTLSAVPGIAVHVFRPTESDWQTIEQLLK